MFQWMFIFLVVALVAGALGFTNVAGAATSIVKLLFYIFIILFLVSLVMNVIG